MYQYYTLLHYYYHLSFNKNSIPTMAITITQVYTFLLLLPYVWLYCLIWIRITYMYKKYLTKFDLMVYGSHNGGIQPYYIPK